MGLLKKGMVAAILLTVAGCRDVVSPISTRSRLEISRQRWASQQMSRYDFTLEQLCFCVVRGPVRVSVRNGVVISATEIATGQAVDTRYVPTIESLFDFIDRGIENHAVVLEVTYNPVVGYPEKIVYDGEFRIADDEVTYQVSAVVRVASSS